MVKFRHLSPDLARRIATAFVAIAIALRSLIPVGMMPDLPRLADGEFRLVICTGHGPQTSADFADAILAAQGHQTKSERGDPTRPDSGEPGSQLCPFAMALSLLGFGLVVLLAVFLRAAEPPIWFAAYRSLFRSRGFDPRTARGPPALFC